MIDRTQIQKKKFPSVTDDRGKDFINIYIINGCIDHFFFASLIHQNYYVYFLSTKWYYNIKRKRRMFIDFVIEVGSCDDSE